MDNINTPLEYIDFLSKHYENKPPTTHYRLNEGPVKLSLLTVLNNTGIDINNGDWIKVSNNQLDILSRAIKNRSPVISYTLYEIGTLIIGKYTGEVSIFKDRVEGNINNSYFVHGPSNLIGDNNYPPKLLSVSSDGYSGAFVLNPDLRRNKRRKIEI